VRKNYERDMVDKDHRRRQMGTALYFIDKMALRAGHEKDEDEAETVGCCTLKVSVFVCVCVCVHVCVFVCMCESADACADLRALIQTRMRHGQCRDIVRTTCTINKCACVYVCCVCERVVYVCASDQYMFSPLRIKTFYLGLL